MHLSDRLLGHRGVRTALVACGLATVLITPFAVGGSQPASAAVIGGASSLADSVSVDFRDGHKAKTGDVHVIAFNDFHGNMEPAGLNIYGHFAGGAAYLGKAVKDKQALYGDQAVTVMAGDGIGAAPLVSQLFRNEPAVVAMNLMHVDYASVGNHEFDQGSAELKRMQNGGCGIDNCAAAPYTVERHGKVKTTNTYPGADFQYLSANVVDAKGRTLFPAYGIQELTTSTGEDVRVGIIGEVLKDTPTIVTPSGVAGLTFQDEAPAANRAAKELKKRGVKTIILVIHQGGGQTAPPAITGPNSCQGNLAGSPIEAISNALDPSIGVVVSGHTHNEYRCTLTHNGVSRLVTSASSFGRILTDITLTVDTRSGALVTAAATNSIVDNALNAPGTGVVRQADPSKEDPTIKAVVDEYVTKAAPLANKVIGKITGDLTRTPSPTGEENLGDVIADSQLAATAPANLGAAVIAFMNPGGIRTDIKTTDISAGEAVGEVTYGEAFAVQPFGNSLVTKTMTGAQIRSLLEQQFVGCGGQTTQRILQISTGFSYQQNAAAATCAAKIGTITLGGVALADATTYRVTMNSFLATGGDGFTVFNSGTNALGGAQDIDAQVAYFAANPTGIVPPALTRITSF